MLRQRGKEKEKEKKVSLCQCCSGGSARDRKSARVSESAAACLEIGMEL